MKFECFHVAGVSAAGKMLTVFVVFWKLKNYQHHLSVVVAYLLLNDASNSQCCSSASLIKLMSQHILVRFCSGEKPSSVWKRQV